MKNKTEKPNGELKILKEQGEEILAVGYNQKEKVEVKKKKVMPVKEKALPIVVPKLKLNIIKVGLRGTTPLLMDKFPDETRAQILDKQIGLTKGSKQLRDMDKEYVNAIHYINDGLKVGFPAQAFKSGMIESTSFVGSRDFSKKLLKGIQIINSEGNDLIPISYDIVGKLKHYPKDSNTKISPMFENWKCELIIQYDANNISPQDIITLLNYSGFYYGIGIWSPRAKCGGKYGMYEVDVGGK